LWPVPAERTYYKPVRPFLPPEELARSADASRDGYLLDVDDVMGKRVIQTRLAHTVTIREENASAALEVMGRFALDPRWLVFLPPAMSPTATSDRPDLLEHPNEAFASTPRTASPR
jgi:protein phosphatase